MKGRRERFREQMLRLNPAAKADRAVGEGWVVARPGRSFARTLVQGLELFPKGSHILLGGIGAGKTTELMVARNMMLREKVGLVLYVDASTFCDTASVAQNALLAIVGLALAEALGDEEVAGAFRKVAYPQQVIDLPTIPGGNAVIALATAIDSMSRTIPGVMSPPQKINHKNVYVEHLHKLRNRSGDPIVLLVDGFDREPSAAHLNPLLEHDLPILEELEICTVLVWPLAALLDPACRDQLKRSELHTLPYPDVEADPDSRRFFEEILSKRAVDSELLPDDTRAAIVSGSGGALRDMLSIASGAVQEAFSDGASAVLPHHVAAATLAMGRKLILGTGEDQLTALRRLHETGRFEAITPADIALAVSGRVLFRAEGRFSIHPALIPVLEAHPTQARTAR